MVRGARRAVGEDDGHGGKEERRGGELIEEQGRLQSSLLLGSTCAETGTLIGPLVQLRHGLPLRFNEVPIHVPSSS